MAVNKNFVVKNGIEVNTDLIFTDVTNRKVGIASTQPSSMLEVWGGIGATDINITGVATIASLKGVAALDATTTASSGFRVKNAGEGTIYLEHGSTSNYSDSFYFIAKHASFQIRNISAGTITVNSISVKEVNGNAGLMTNMASNDFSGDTP